MQRWCDGFDHWGSQAQLLAGGNYVVSDGSFNVSTANARTGDYCAQYRIGPAGPGYVQKIVGGTTPSLGFAMAVYITNYTNLNWGWGFLNAGVFNCSLFIGPDGSLVAYTGNKANFLGTSDPGAILIGSYQVIEVFAFADSVNGAIEVRVGGITKLVVNGGDTNASGTGVNSAVAFGKPLGGDNMNMDIDDFVIWDNTGAYCKTFYTNPTGGDLRCRTSFANLNGADQDWTPHGDANAFDCISHVPINPGVDYISASNVGDVSSFGISSIPTNTSTVFSVTQFIAGQKSDSGACEITPSIDSNGNVATGTPFNPPTGGGYYTATYYVNPDGGAGLTYSAVNALLIQAERTA